MAKVTHKYKGPLKEPKASSTTPGVNKFRALAERVLTQKDKALLDSLEPDARNIVVDWFSDALVDGTGQNTIHDALWEIDYHRKPVSVGEFLTDKYYLGTQGSDLYPKWQRDLNAVFSPGSGVSEWLLTGAIGGGKCVKEDTLVNTTFGFVEIGELVRNGGDAVVQAESGMCDVASFHTEGVTETVRMTTKHGHVLEGRGDHRVRVLDGFEVAWRKLSELKPGDCVLQSPAWSFGKTDIPDCAAELIGWAVAEGSREKNGCVLSLHDDEIDYVYALALQAKEWLGCAAVSMSRKFRRVCLWGANVQMYVPRLLSREKEVPKPILQGTRRTVLMFLRGLFSGDGTASCNKSASVTTTSEKMAHQVRCLLTALGYYCSVCPSVASYRKDGKRIITGAKFVVRVLGEDSTRKFSREIGFAHDYKQGAIEARKKNSNSDHSFSFHMPVDVASKFRKLQPKYHRGSVPYGQNKTKTASRMIGRLIAGQACTVSLLRAIRAAGGNLPRIFEDIADDSLLFDTVRDVRPSRAVCYDLSVEDDPSYVAGGFISHNTTIAAIALAYKIYTLSCLRDPLKYYQLMSNTKIVFGIYSITLTQVHDTAFPKLKMLLDSSPYFIEQFPRNKRLDSKIEFTKKPIEVVAGSTSVHAIGKDLFSVVLDEANFMKVKQDKATRQAIGQAYQLYNETSRRLDSRFMRPGGTNPGLMLLMSSRGSTASFMERRITEAAGESSSKRPRGRVGRSAYVSDYALWEIKPEGRYPGAPFRVMLGDRTRKSVVLGDLEKPPPGAEVIEVPGDFKHIFEQDTDAAIRDIAGRATHAISPLFRDPSSIVDAIVPGLVHPFTCQSITVGERDDVRIEDFYQVSAACRVVGSVHRPRLNPEIPRYMHIDLSLTGDCAGITMSHPAGLVRYKTKQFDGTMHYITRMKVVVDFMLNIIPPRGCETDLSKIASFVSFLRQFYSLGRVTCDGFQSAYLLQGLRKMDLIAAVFSVDRTEDPYIMLRSIFMDRCIAMYDYVPVRKELEYLERNLDKKKVDHPDKYPDGTPGSKDVADSLCGSVYWCLMDKSSFRSEAVLETEDRSDWMEVPEKISVQADYKPSPLYVPRTVGGVTAARTPTAQFDWDRLRDNMTGKK